MNNSTGAAKAQSGFQLFIKNNFNKFAIYVIFLILCVIFAIIEPSFISGNNIMNVLRQISITGYIAVGMLMVIITGGIDLAAGFMVGLCAAIACDFAHPGMPWGVALLVGLGLGALFGALSGVLVSLFGLPAFIATLGVKLIVNGIALIYTGGAPTTDLDEGFLQLGQGDLIGIPIPVVILVIVLIVGWFLLNKTKYGRYLFAIGGNETAAKLSGVPVKLTKFAVYVVSGICSGLCGLVVSARTSAGSPVAGQNYEMDAITIVVIGGCSLSGGSGSISGAIGGMLLMGVVTNGMNLLNITSYWQQVVKGIIIVLAVIFDMYSKKKK